MTHDLDEDDTLAAEYVLGVAPDRAAAERRIAQDADFAARVALWTALLAGMNDGFADTPAPHLLPRIEARLFGTPARRWRWPALGGLVAAGLAAFLILAPMRDDTVTVRLAGPDQALVVQAAYSPTDGMLRMERMAGPAAPEGSAYEGWLILPGQAPSSIGVLGDAMMEVPAWPMPTGTVIAISLEPAGGSPTGQPTGPVLVTAGMEI